MRTNAVANGYDVEKVVIPGAGPILREFREKKSLTLEEVARRAGLHKSAASRYECGTVSINLRVLEQFAAAIGISPQDVIHEAQALLLEKVKVRYQGTDFESLVEDTCDIVTRDTD